MCCQPIFHEEADTRVILLVQLCANGDMRKVSTSTVESNIVVLVVAFLHRLDLDKLRVDFGTGNHFRNIAKRLRPL
ncbi:hypothetical protein Hamer_G003907 [Homarus americanus]|uniref:Uncharacterized protein n=1 Tax=Homarus americanus TaxID=6706 RepID=A0A8J5NEK0_HOMAM|nr:hypothetical protein Hamer_G003907 [Homarus americanus]